MTNQEAAEAAHALADHDDLGAEHLVKLAYKKGSDVCIINRIFIVGSLGHTITSLFKEM
jgi:ATP-dependent protease HslVU (ClpYQ) peptidase subunit